MFDACSYPPRQISAIGVVAGLLPSPKDVQRILSLEYLLDQVWNNVRHGQFDVSAQNVAVAERNGDLRSSRAVSPTW